MNCLLWFQGTRELAYYMDIVECFLKSLVVFSVSQSICSRTVSLISNPSVSTVTRQIQAEKDYDINLLDGQETRASGKRTTIMKTMSRPRTCMCIG